jgi:hypothetical protein
MDNSGQSEAGNCRICRCKLNGPDPLTRNCDGDCLQCMAVVGEEPDCMPEAYFRLGFRAGVYAEGGGAYEYFSDEMKAEEDADWIMERDSLKKDDL